MGKVELDRMLSKDVKHVNRNLAYLKTRRELGYKIIKHGQQGAWSVIQKMKEEKEWAN